MKRNPSRYSVLKRIKAGSTAIIKDQVNIYRAKIGEKTKIDAFVYIEEDVEIGDNVKIRPFTFIPTGVRVEDDVFIGPGVMFTNDKYPRARGKWKLMKTILRKGCSIGAGSVILPGLTIGEYSLVGGGSVVTKDVEPYGIVVGNPARKIGCLKDSKIREKIKVLLKEKTSGELKGEESDWPWP